MVISVSQLWSTCDLVKNTCFGLESISSTYLCTAQRAGPESAKSCLTWLSFGPFWDLCTWKLRVNTLMKLTPGFAICFDQSFVNSFPGGDEAKPMTSFGQTGVRGPTSRSPTGSTSWWARNPRTRQRKMLSSRTDSTSSWPSPDRIINVLPGCRGQTRSYFRSREKFSTFRGRTDSCSRRPERELQASSFIHPLIQWF